MTGPLTYLWAAFSSFVWLTTRSYYPGPRSWMAMLFAGLFRFNH